MELKRQIKLCRVCVMYGGEENAYRVLVGKPGGKRQLGRLGIDERITLKWISKKWNGTA
jgi:hypothetical protein